MNTYVESLLFSMLVLRLNTGERSFLICSLFWFCFGIVGNIKRSVYRLLDIVPSTDSFDSNAPNLQVFSYATIKAATNNFSSKNKLGEGGFGPVYKVASITNRRSLYKSWNPMQNLYFILLSKVSVLQEYANNLVWSF